jgi:hypothetical protein
MRSCGLLSNARTRKIDNVEEVGLFVDSNGSIKFVLLRSEHLSTFEVWTTSAKLFPVEHVENTLLEYNRVTSSLNTTLSASKFEFFFARPSPPTPPFQN